MKAAIYLDKTKQNSVLRGHPWVYPKAIGRQSATIHSGNWVDIFSADGKHFGIGIYNEHSLYRVRVLAYAFEAMDCSSLESLITERLRQALRLRKNLNLPNAYNTAYRLVNSEGDGLSGLTIDCYHETLVVASSAYWVEAHKERMMRCIHEVFHPRQVVWLSQMKPLQQDGWDKPAVPVDENIKPEIVLEAGIRYQVDFQSLQKTGLFLDQRENHARLAAFTQGKRVLDLYTYQGGFALHAALAQASTVTAIDSSAQAIALAKQNAALNDLHQIEFIAADARDYLKAASDYDVVILDPPKLVPRAKHVEQAKNYYRFLHREVFKAMAQGSMLMTCNCSSALSEEDFVALVSSQAQAVGKIARILGVYGSAACHPKLAAFPEGHYLTAVLLSVG